jgi:hypothetical protein
VLRGLGAGCALIGVAFLATPIMGWVMEQFSRIHLPIAGWGAVLALVAIIFGVASILLGEER